MTRECGVEDKLMGLGPVPGSGLRRRLAPRRVKHERVCPSVVYRVSTRCRICAHLKEPHLGLKSNTPKIIPQCLRNLLSRAVLRNLLVLHFSNTHQMASD